MGIGIPFEIHNKPDFHTMYLNCQALSPHNSMNDRPNVLTRSMCLLCLCIKWHDISVASMIIVCSSGGNACSSNITQDHV